MGSWTRADAVESGIWCDSERSAVRVRGQKILTLLLTGGGCDVSAQNLPVQSCSACGFAMSPARDTYWCIWLSLGSGIFRFRSPAPAVWAVDYL